MTWNNVYCPNCVFFGVDCHPDPEEFSLRCDAFTEIDLFLIEEGEGSAQEDRRNYS